MGAADELRRASGGLLLPAGAEARDDALGTIRRILSGDEVTKALDEGRRLAPDEWSPRAQPGAPVTRL